MCMMGLWNTDEYERGEKWEFEAGEETVDLKIENGLK